MNLLRDGSGSVEFLRYAFEHGYGMQEDLIDPEFCSRVSDELDAIGELYDYNEQNDVRKLYNGDSKSASALHRLIVSMLSAVHPAGANRLSLFSVRVFEPGVHATTVHRNHEVISPWAIGVTLKGTCQFSVYDQTVLRPYETKPLLGDDDDPMPRASMTAGAGAVWALYTEYEQLPHSGGVVTSDEERELLIFYGMQW